MDKTNAMRLLDAAKIKYEAIEYEVDENNLSGEYIAKKLNMNPNMVFKTLVLCGDKTKVLVCCIPVNQEINLKALAKASGNKKVEMVLMKDLLNLTGYIRGGCSPIGMKKKYPTYIDLSALSNETIAVSAGVRGMQIILNVQDLIKYTGAKTENFITG